MQSNVRASNQPINCLTHAGYTDAFFEFDHATITVMKHQKYGVVKYCYLLYPILLQTATVVLYEDEGYGGKTKVRLKSMLLKLKTCIEHSKLENHLSQPRELNDLFLEL